MWGTNGARGYNSPLRIEPEFGQRPENNVETPVNESWHVLHEDVSGSNLANDAGELEPEPAPGAFFDARAFPGNGDVLAGEPSADEIGLHSGSVKGANVSVNGSLIEPSVGHSGAEEFLAVGVSLDISDAPAFR